jgi:PII-like signaling protein
MLTSHPAKVLHIYANSTDQWHGRPLYSAIIHTCLQLGIAGATAFRSFEGYGAHHQLHTARLLSLSEDLPVRIEVVDAPEAIDRLLKALGEMLRQTLVTINDTQVMRWTPPAPGGE